MRVAADIKRPPSSIQPEPAKQNSGTCAYSLFRSPKRNPRLKMWQPRSDTAWQNPFCRGAAEAEVTSISRQKCYHESWRRIQKNHHTRKKSRNYPEASVRKPRLVDALFHQACRDVIYLVSATSCVALDSAGRHGYTQKTAGHFLPFRSTASAILQKILRKYEHLCPRMPRWKKSQLRRSPAEV